MRLLIWFERDPGKTRDRVAAPKVETFVPRHGAEPALVIDGAPSGSRSERAAAATTARIPTAIRVSVGRRRQPTQITPPPPLCRVLRVAGLHSRGRRTRSLRGRPRAPPNTRRKRGRSRARTASSAARYGSLGSLRGSRAMAVAWRARAAEAAMPSSISSIARQPASAPGKNDEMIADSLQLGDDMRGQDHRQPASRLTASITVCKNSRRASGSRVARGSSKISRSGHFASASVKATCACCPPDSLPTLPLQWNARASPARARATLSSKRRVELAPERQHLSRP